MSTRKPMTARQWRQLESFWLGAKSLFSGRELRRVENLVCARTRHEHEHPEWWECYPCDCETCRSYEDA
jgi:hypothetical protein